MKILNKKITIIVSTLLIGLVSLTFNGIEALNSDENTLQMLREEEVYIEDMVTISEFNEINDMLYSPIENIDIEITIVNNEQLLEESFHYLANIPLSREIQEFIYNSCKENDLNYVDVLALIKIESGFNANATHKNTNGTTDYGLFQINSCNIEAFRNALNITGDILNPYNNAKMGIYELSNLSQKWDSSKNNEEQHRIDVLSSYNKGYAGYINKGKATTYLQKHEAARKEIKKIIEVAKF